MLPLRIPSPSQGVWHLGALPIRAYAIAILVGIVAAVFIAIRRFTRRTEGGTADDVLEITFWAVPFGSSVDASTTSLRLPARTSGRAATRSGRCSSGRAAWASGAPSPWARSVLDRVPTPEHPVRRVRRRVAPGLLVAQAIGRLGNWFNQELYGAPTDLPGASRSIPSTW